MGYAVHGAGIIKIPREQHQRVVAAVLQSYACLSLDSYFQVTTGSNLEGLLKAWGWEAGLRQTVICSQYSTCMEVTKTQIGWEEILSNVGYGAGIAHTHYVLATSLLGQNHPESALSLAVLTLKYYQREQIYPPYASAPLI